VILAAGVGQRPDLPRCSTASNIPAPNPTEAEGQHVIHTSPFPAIDIPDVPLTQHVLGHARALGDKPALIDGATGRILTYAELDAQVRALAGGLREHGLVAGDTVALMAPNSPDYAVVFHAVALAGMVITTINPTYTHDEVHHQFHDAGAKLAITVAGILPVVQAAAAGTGVTTIAVIDEIPDGAQGVVTFASLMGAPLTAQVPVQGDTVVALPYSSGTTGLSKGVMLTHHNLVANIEQVRIPGEIAADDVIMGVLPFFHIYGMQVIMNTTLAAGGTVITMPRFDLVQFLELHQKYGITRSFVAPPIVVALAKHPVVDEYDLSSVKQMFSGAAPLSAEVAEEAAARLKCEVVQGYGMTELSPVSHMTVFGGYKAGSVGPTVPNAETAIVDPGTGEFLGLDVDGEVWVRGPGVMKGYLNNDAATAATIDADGWLHSGDVGHIDADGHLYVVDRIKELIKFKGFQVPPAELEALLLTHPAVADAAVIGAPDDEAGEIPSAFVVLKPGADATEADVMAFVANQVAHYKQVRKLTFVDAIPKSPSGKILRRILRDDYL
jgi:acyl-CoA synthetase (AMP-forming)/AMP-acid ligase II